MPTRLSPISPAAPDAILVGDPRRAFLLAQELMTSPLMSHLARGLWGYTGTTPAGTELTIQSTGIGGPSAVTVIHDLAGESVRRVVRLGTCLALSESIEPGSVVRVSVAEGRDGSSQGLTRSLQPALAPDPVLNELLDGLGRPGRISSHDLVARLDSASGEVGTDPRDEQPVVARDLQSAAVFAASGRFSIAAAALLIVVETSGPVRVAESDLEKLFIELGRQVIERLQPVGR